MNSKFNKNHVHSKTYVGEQLSFKNVNGVYLGNCSDILHIQAYKKQKSKRVFLIF